MLKPSTSSSHNSSTVSNPHLLSIPITDSNNCDEVGLEESQQFKSTFTLSDINYELPILDKRQYNNLLELDDLKKVKLSNISKVTLAHININSIRNKFDFLANYIKNYVDTLMISETKLDDSFPLSQFKINGFNTPYRLDRDSHGGGILLFVREGIPSHLVLCEELPFEFFFIEFSIRNNKWLLCCCYNPNKNLIEKFLNQINIHLSLLLSSYENIIFMGDFNSAVTDVALQNFCESFNFSSLIKVPTCFKNPDKPTCIDLILTNKPKSFQNSKVIETGLSDFHGMTVTFMKTTFNRLPPKEIYYRNFKNFDNSCFLEELVKYIDEF